MSKKSKRSQKMCFRVNSKDRVSIIKLVKRGLSTEEIRSKFEYEYTTFQIAAIRAWVTMGLY